MATDGTIPEINDTAGTEKTSEVHPQVPGGDSQTQPPEPISSEETVNSDMGCASSRASAETQKNTGVETMDTSNGSSKLEKRNVGLGSNGNDLAKKRTKRDEKSRSPSRSEDDENDKNPRQQSGRVTRSKVASSKIYEKFESSDEEDNSRYSSWAKDDVKEYRDRYPNKRDNKNITDNLRFYTNEISSHPDGDLIDHIHSEWSGDYRKLEYHHGYIQWLFPLQEKGLNWSAEPLQKHEIESIKQDKQALKRILTSYEMMLDFYGFEFADKKTGDIRRSSTSDYRNRFRNLNTSSHNYLRITRILKCLGEFDYEYLKFPFLEAILRESITEDTLSNCLRSCQDYWIGTLLDSGERRAIRQYARELIKYRNKGSRPPSSCRATRPSPKASPITSKPAASTTADVSNSF